MAGATPKQVQIGEQSYTIQRFKGLKAIMAMACMTRIAREVPDIMADAMKQYQKRNTITITEAMARLPRWSGFTTEDFDAAASRNGGKREIELPTPMTVNEQIMYALPMLLEGARKEVTRLLALLIIPNAELLAADKQDDVEGALDKYEDALLGEAELDQLVELCFGAQEVLTEQLSDRKDQLGNLARSLWKNLQTRQTPPQPPPSLQDPAELEEQAQSNNGTSTLATSTPDAPISSTDSVTPTDGTENKPSMVSPGVSS